MKTMEKLTKIVIKKKESYPYIKRDSYVSLNEGRNVEGFVYETYGNMSNYYESFFVKNFGFSQKEAEAIVYKYCFTDFEPVPFKVFVDFVKNLEVEKIELWEGNLKESLLDKDFLLNFFDIEILES
jgi:hypothetical protein